MKGHTAYAVRVIEREKVVFDCIQSPRVSPVNDKGKGSKLATNPLRASGSCKRAICPGESASSSLANECHRVPPVPWLSVGTYVVGSAEIKNLDEQIVVDLRSSFAKMCCVPNDPVLSSQSENFGKGRNRTD
jgi:hypothetical protein